MIAALLFLILFALLLPKALKFLLFVMFIGVIMILGEVRAEPNECPAFYLTGLFYRAANVCDHSWLARDGLRIMSDSAAQCRTTPKRAKALLKNGFDDFDAGVANHGKTATCAYVDTEMNITKNNGK
jgi:hypothetical protein